MILNWYENWTLTADLEKRLQVFGNKCYRKMLGISYYKYETKRTKTYFNKLFVLPHTRWTQLVGQFHPVICTLKYHT